MRPCQIAACCWSALNLGLALLLPADGRFAGLAAAVLALFPLLRLFFAEEIAATLERGTAPVLRP